MCTETERQTVSDRKFTERNFWRCIFQSIYRRNSEHVSLFNRFRSKGQCTTEVFFLKSPIPSRLSVNSSSGCSFMALRRIGAYSHFKIHIEGSPTSRGHVPHIECLKKKSRIEVKWTNTGKQVHFVHVEWKNTFYCLNWILVRIFCKSTKELRAPLVILQVDTSHFHMCLHHKHHLAYPHTQWELRWFHHLCGCQWSFYFGWVPT